MDTPQVEMVTISKEDYQALLHDSRVLNLLEASGVDIWEWYGEALSSLEDEDE